MSGLFPLRGKFTLHALLITLCLCQCSASNSSHLVQPLGCAQTDVASVWPLIEWTDEVPNVICNSCHPVAAMTSCGCGETEIGKAPVYHD